MAYEYDRFEREDGGGSFLMGLLAGTVLGAGLGMLFAPRPGAELRTQLTDQASKLRTSAGGAYSQVGERVTQMVDRGREAYDRARTSGDPDGIGGMGNTGSSGTGSTGTGGAGTGGAGNTGSMTGSTYTGAGTNDRS